MRLTAESPKTTIDSTQATPLFNPLVPSEPEPAFAVLIVTVCVSPEPAVVVVAWPPPPPPRVTTLLIPPPPVDAAFVAVVCAGRPDFAVEAPAEADRPVLVVVAPSNTPVYVRLYADSATRMLDGIGAIVAPTLEHPCLF